MYSCKEATYLISKKEEGRLGLFQKLKLGMHMSMCRFCRGFERQTRLLTGRLNKLQQQPKELSEEKKKEISELLNQ